MSTNEKLTIIVINYDSTKQLNKLLFSLNIIKEIIDRVIIIDNNSSDIDLLQPNFNNFKVIHNKINVGFSKAVNQGIKASCGKYLLLINPDSLIIDKSLINTFHLIQRNKKIGAVGGKIQKMDNSDYHLTANSKPNFLTGLFEFTNLKKIFPNNKYSKNFWIENSLNIKNPIEVDSICGAFIIFRKFIKKKLNLFDEKFFLYLEDLDFGLNIKSKGYKVIFDPNSVIKHLGGSSSKSKYNIVLKHWYKSRKIFFKKHLNIIEGGILSIIFTLEEYFLQIYHFIKHDPTD